MQDIKDMVKPMQTIKDKTKKYKATKQHKQRIYTAVYKKILNSKADSQINATSQNNSKRLNFSIVLQGAERKEELINAILSRIAPELEAMNGSIGIIRHYLNQQSLTDLAELIFCFYPEMKREYLTQRGLTLLDWNNALFYRIWEGRQEKDLIHKFYEPKPEEIIKLILKAYE